jgi:hypothetical protein
MKTLDRPWGQTEKEAWFKAQRVQRSYQDDVVAKIDRLKTSFGVTQYGEIKVGQLMYPLFLIQSKSFDPSLKTVLITGGVHGYETSGVHGALAFMQDYAGAYQGRFNFICAPCISPWAYETINRWNPQAIDPNRSFHPQSPAAECRLFMASIDALKISIFAHFDLHETTDTDNTVFRIALQQRDAKPQVLSPIPDGFYVVGDTGRPQTEFQKAVIASVRKVTHIAAPDEQGMIIGVPVQDDGVIYYDMKMLFLCGGFSDAVYTTTTEVYPDSPKVTPEVCNRAQVAAIQGGLDFI